MKGQEIIQEWNGMTADEQISMITACVYKSANRDMGIQALSQNGHDINEYINETWERITNSLTPKALTACNERRAAQGKQPTTLISLVYRSAHAAVSALCYRDNRENNKTTHSAAADYSAGYDMENPVIIRAILDRFRSERDSTDQRIIELVSIGFSEREISAEVGISNVAVHKRIVKIRNSLLQAIA